jgi:hypothetical protein
MHCPQQGSFQWEAIHSTKVPKVSSFGKPFHLILNLFFPNFKVGNTVLVICNYHKDYTIEASVVVIFASFIWSINKHMLFINDSTTKWYIPSIRKPVADCFQFFMAARQLTQTKEKLHNMIHKYWFHIEVTFLLYRMRQFIQS